MPRFLIHPLTRYFFDESTGISSSVVSVRLIVSCGARSEPTAPGGASEFHVQVEKLVLSFVWPMPLVTRSAPRCDRAVTVEVGAALKAATSATVDGATEKRL